MVQIRSLPAVVGELVLVRHGQRAGRARLDAQAAQDAAQVVDLVYGARSARRENTVPPRCCPALDVDRVGRAGPGAQLAADALLQPVGPAVELVVAVEPGRGRLFHLGVLDGVDLLEHLRKVTPNPLIGLRKSSTGDLLRGGRRSAGRAPGPAHPDAVVVRQVHRRHRDIPGAPGSDRVARARRRPGPAPGAASSSAGAAARRCPRRVTMNSSIRSTTPGADQV